jgi:hypothetical protein
VTVTCSVFSHLERDLDMALSTEIVHFGRLNLGDDIDKVSAVTQITVVKMEFIWS